ncbi:MAG: hypothetical protein ACERLM_17755, partial [Acidimicrobiales bacterium]
RWGTNLVEESGFDLSISGTLTRAFSTLFDASLPTLHEAQAATGDSGGAVFSKVYGVWELTGIQVARATFQEQPDRTALFGNESWSAQLSHYRDQILDIIAESGPACSNGIDDDGDGLVDLDDPGCVDEADLDERDPLLRCDDGADNDGDGRIDFDPVTFASPGDQYTLPAGVGDPGCKNPTWSTESPQC